MKTAHAKQRAEKKLSAALDIFGSIAQSLAVHKPAAGESGAANGAGVYLNPVIHERTRLAILTALFTATEGHSFPDLRDTLALTDGNLMAHLRTLEEAGLVERTKAGAGRASSTTLRLSGNGRAAFAQYLDQLEALVHAARRH
jgi:DNA-binding HxlR family transcriptional regulator